MTEYDVCTLPGDGIGPEIMSEAKKVLAVIGEQEGVTFRCTDQLLGGCAIDATRAAGGVPTAFPEATYEAASASDAVLLAAVGGPRWDSTDSSAPRPEQGLLGIRKRLGLHVNVRPVRIYPALASASPLRPELLDGVDLVIVRELTGGLYFGAREYEEGVAGAGVGGSVGAYASDRCEYTEAEIERVVRWAYEAAARRPAGKVTSVDKANVLNTSRLWRSVAHRVAAEYPQITSNDMLVDNCAMQLVAAPSQFDVLVTENTFGDILSDEASMLTGSLGMLASASFGEGPSLYEPTHGSAPDIAGRGVANPLAQILCVGLMLRYSFAMDAAADRLDAAVEAVLDEGWRTADIACSTGDGATPADHVIGTRAMGDKVVEHLPNV